MAIDQYLNKLGDPWNGDIVNSPKRCKSTYYSGTYNTIIAPAAANFPEDDTTKTRYAIELPIVPHPDLVTYPLIVRDSTTSTVLTRVTGSPGTNEYRISPSTSERKNLIELNSGQIGHSIDFDGYAISSILTAEAFMAIINRTDKQLLYWSTYATWYNLITGTSGANTTGAGTFTLPTGFSTQIEVILIGGGGGGAGGGTGNGTNGYGGGGGGSGSVAKYEINYSSPISYQIGNYGAGGGIGANGSNGSNSTFGIGYTARYGEAGQKSGGVISGANGGPGGGSYFGDFTYQSGAGGGNGGNSGNSAPSGLAAANSSCLSYTEYYYMAGGGGGGAAANSSGTGGNGGNYPKGGVGAASGGGAGGGAGGSCSFGVGGNGGDGKGGSTAGNAGVDATGMGAGGGGGGGGGPSSGAGGVGKNGAPGGLYIYGYKSLI